MQSLFFHDWTITGAFAGQSKAFGHSFGGPPAHRGVRREECGRLLHLLHWINQDDSVFQPVIPGICWLPLYYCFDYRVSALGYRLLSEESIQIYFWPNEPNVSKEESYPEKDYPTEFPVSGLELYCVPFDPTDPDDAYEFGGVFGLGKLSQKDRAAVLEREAEQCEWSNGYRPDSEDKLLRSLSGPFVQGRPDSRCPNPQCENHSREGQLRPFAVVPNEPVPGVTLFGRWEVSVQLIFEVCPTCYTIHASNQSD